MTNTETTYTRTAYFLDGAYRLQSTDRDPVTGEVTVRFRRRFYDEVPYIAIFAFVPNVEMFQAALDQITLHPETWNQSDWLSPLPSEVEADAISAAPECGTAGCLAGTVALLAGARPVLVTEEDSNGGPTYTFTDWGVVSLPGSERGEAVSDFAERELGISTEVADCSKLFSGSNSLFDLWERSQVLCGGALDVPDRDVIEAAQAVSAHLYG